MTTARALRGPFDYRLPPELRGGEVQIGSMLVVPFGRREVLGVVVGLAERSEVAEGKLLAPLRALELGVPRDLVALAEWIAAEYCSTISRALGLVLPPGAARRLSGRKRRAVTRRVHLPVGARSPEPPTLTVEQREVLESLTAALTAGAPARRLLHGITGSGKTEIYLRAAATALQQRRGAIVLVPEIALTPQIVGRFVERFGDTVAVLHSQLRPAERYEEWRRLRSGEARVCVGPRSAVFAPIEDLGLIVVDEEHDASYKHEGDPRYDARDVAAERAKRCGALLLLGSATPRPESVRAVPSPLRLPGRVDGRPLPEVEILDMRGDDGDANRDCTRRPLVRSQRCAALVGRRWCCSTVVVGRTSFLVAPAGGYGAARTVTWRSCCTTPRATWHVITVGIASPRRRVVATAARRPWRATVRVPSACSTSSRERSTTGASRCSVWMLM